MAVQAPVRRALRQIAAAVAVAVTAGSALAQTTILNVSYDVSRELYKDINPVFATHWKTQSGEDVAVNQSHGGSSKQAMSIAAGLEADVITMNQAPDIDILVERGNLVAEDWRKRFPHDATPYTTTSVFLVRKGNPKGIKDWDDLTRAGLQVIVPNPKTSGNGRYTYLAAWGYALDKTGSEAAAKDFVTKLLGNVPVLDGGGRGATTTFTQRDVGDVLVTFENEAILFSTEGQEVIARHNFRPRDPAVLKKYAAQFPAIRTFRVEDKLGGWKAANAKHFADGALYDQIIVSR